MQIVIFLITLFLASSIVSPVSAGGGPVALNADPLGSRTNLIIVDIFGNGSCTYAATVSFVNPTEGDEISPYTPDTKRYIQRHYFGGQENPTWLPICTKYFQAVSGKSQERTIRAVVTDNGTTTTSELLIYDIESPDFRAKRPEVDVISERYLEENKREVSLQWNDVMDAGKYTVFTKEGLDLFKKGTPVTTTSETRVTVTLPAFTQLYVSVVACSKDDPCQTEPEYTYAILLDVMRNVDGGVLPKTLDLPAPYVSPLPPTLNTIQPASNEAELEALHEKVAALEDKLKDSEEKTSFLQRRLNQLISFIRSLFPSFE